MKNMARQDEDFGRDYGLIHEVIVTGRKVGAGQAFWAKLAHNEDLFRETILFVEAGGNTSKQRRANIQVTESPLLKHTEIASELIKRGFILCDSEGNVNLKKPTNINSSYDRYGLLINEVFPGSSPRGKTRRSFVGLLIFCIGETKLSEWTLDVYGRAKFNQLISLAEELSKRFNTKINVKLQSEGVKYESFDGEFEFG